MYLNPAAREWRTTAPEPALAFHRSLEGYAPTPLTSYPALADELGVGQVLVKDESSRLGLPAFKILGASWAIHRAVVGRPRLVAVTDGNHGRAVARVARLLGLEARIHVPHGLTPAALDGILGEGASLVPHDATYDEVVRIAATDDGLLIQDTSWPGYTDVPRWIVEGYTTLFHEIDALAEPDLVVCPVGVGSLAHAMVDHYRSPSGTAGTRLLAVEPETAACVAESLRAGHPVTVDTSFPTSMAGLNCGTPSDLGWPSLLAGLDAAVTVSEDECRSAVLDLGGVFGPCGAATLAGARNALSDIALDPDAVVVLLMTEGAAAQGV